MSRLLVSVRNASEAEAALAGGADLIDVKEPLRGPLGAADAQTLAAVVERVGKRAPLSAALGEWHEGHRLDAALAGRVAFAKFGLAGAVADADWHKRWQAAVEALPEGTVPVAVAYADWQRAQAPPPGEVLERGLAIGCGALLIDTFDKRAGSTAEVLHQSALARLLADAQAAGMLTVVAGGLSAADLAALAWLAPDYFGVRGAACSGGRASRLETPRVAALTRVLTTAGAQCAREADAEKGIAPTLAD